jgi:hypothetical protein
MPRNIFRINKELPSLGRARDIIVLMHFEILAGKISSSRERNVLRKIGMSILGMVTQPKR